MGQRGWVSRVSYSQDVCRWGRLLLSHAMDVACCRPCQPPAHRQHCPLLPAARCRRSKSRRSRSRQRGMWRRGRQGRQTASSSGKAAAAAAMRRMGRWSRLTWTRLIFPPSPSPAAAFYSLLLPHSLARLSLSPRFSACLLLWLTVPVHCTPLKCGWPLPFPAAVTTVLCSACNACPVQQLKLCCGCCCQVYK